MFRQFNLKNPTETRLLTILANGEGIITTDEFKRYANSTMLSRYRSAGYVKQMPNALKGTFQVTEKFKRQYRRQVDPAKRFSGSHAPAHAAGVNRVLALVPRGVTIRTGAEVQTAPLPHSFHQAMSRIADEWRQERDTYDRCPANEREEAIFHAEYTAADEKYRSASSEAVSTPDFGLSLTQDQLHEFVVSNFQHYINHDYSPFLQDLYNLGTARLHGLERQGDPTVKLYVEIVTDSYTRMDIFQKECWAEATDSTIIYLPV